MTATTAVAAALVLAGCGSGSTDNASGGGTKTITFVAAEYSDATAPYWQDMARRFAAANPGYTVHVDIQNWNNIEDYVKNLVQNHQQPDVLNVDHWIDFAQDNLLYKATDVLSAGTLSDMLPNAKQIGTYKGSQYGIPFILSARLMYYNKDWFTKAGIDPATPPTTWAELTADAGKLKAAGCPQPYGMPLGSEEAQAETLLWLLGNGGGFVDSGGKWAINSSQNVQTLSYMAGLVKAGLTEPNPDAVNRTTGTFADFEAGRVGMMLGLMTPMEDITSKHLPVNFGLAAVAGKDGALDSTLGVGDFVMAFDKGNGGNKDAVSRWLNFVFQQQNYAKFLTGEKFLPTTRSANDAMAADPADASLKPFLAVLPKATFYPQTDPAWPTVEDAMKHQIGTAVQGADPKSVLDAIQQTAQKAEQNAGG
ncbi:MAG TPA: extracellular solute-binding protein [Pseudonocardiaceae bacterium]|nr:extracellular solute-binding protein [Pseudonocardiaceae bacterium]